MKILFAFPSEREAAAVRLKHPPLITGSGERAGLAVSERLQDERPDLVILAGLAGALDPSLRPGAVVLCRQSAAPGREILDPDRYFTEDVRNELRNAGRSFVYSRLLTLPEPAATADAKLQLWNEHGAGAVDMETYQVAAACEERRVPWIAVRAIVDTSGQALPRGLAQWRQPGDERGAGIDALRAPWQWPAYGRLGLQYRAARKSLSAALPAVVGAARQTRIVETLEVL